jgi:hypothetical protein
VTPTAATRAWLSNHSLLFSCEVTVHPAPSTIRPAILRASAESML